MTFGAAVNATPANVVWNAPDAVPVPVATVIADPPTEDTTTRGTAFDSMIGS